MTKHPDYALLTVVAILIVLGIVILASVSAAIAQEKFDSPIFYLFRHFSFGILLGGILGFIAYKLPLKLWERYAAVLLIINLVLMVLVFLPQIGIRLGGASRWINLGFTSLQPSELLKITSILYFAAWLPSLAQRHKKNLSKSLVAFLAVLGLIGFLLAMQPDVSTMGIIAVCIILMYFISGTPFWHSLAMISGGLAILAVLIKIAPYRLERLLVFLKPDIDPLGISYQIKQALIAIGSGGFWGNGIGMSMQKFGFLPQPMSDSIFAVFAEEMGFIGALIVVVLFLILAWRGFKISKETASEFAKLTAMGITSWITIQAFVNIGATIGILPLSGIPLPFISYGGTALASELIGVGILLNISKHS